MTNGAGNVPVSLRLSGAVLILGLCIEAISLIWVHPLAFLAFFVVGGLFLAAGVLLFLYSILFRTSPSRSE
jgi:hypothetical protein